MKKTLETAVLNLLKDLPARLFWSMMDRMTTHINCLKTN